MRRSHAVFLAIAVAMPSLQRPARAESNLRAELREAARQIAEAAAKLEVDRVDLDPITFRTRGSNLDTAAGAGIAQVLTEELRARKIRVARGSRLRITGRYDDVTDIKSRLLAARIELQVIDPAGVELLTVTRGVFGDAALSILFGATVDFSPRGNEATRNRDLENSISTPAVTVDRSLVRPAKATPYGMEVLVLSGDRYEPRVASITEGQAFVKVADKETFAVRLSNASRHDAAVFLAIDGIPLFTFSRVPNYSQVIVPAGATAVVQGWFLGRDPVLDKFRAGVHPAQPGLEQIPRGDGPGVITAVFSACYPIDSPLPEDEPVHRQPFQRSIAVDTSGKQLVLTNPGLESPSALPTQADDADPAGKGTPRDEPSAASSRGPVPAPLGAISRDFRSRFQGKEFEFGVVRTAISVRFEK